MIYIQSSVPHRIPASVKKKRANPELLAIATRHFRTICLAMSKPQTPAPTTWHNICCSFPFKLQKRSDFRTSTRLARSATLKPVSHDSIVTGEGFPTSGHAMNSQQELPSYQNPIKKTVQKLMRRASLSFRPAQEKGPLVISGPGKKDKGKRKALTGDGESGVVLDERDAGDDYYVADALAKRIDPVTYLPAEISAHILSYLDHRTLANCESVARHWRVAATNPHVWRLVFWNEHGPWQSKPGKDWKTMFIANKRLQERWQKADMSYKYMNGHTDSVYCVQFDDKKVITGSRDRTIRVWDMKTAECIKVLSSNPDYNPQNENLDSAVGTPLQDFHTASVLCLQFDDQILVTGSSDSTCIVWSLPDYTPVGRLAFHTAGVLDVCFDDMHIVSCSKDTTVCIWDRNTRRLVRQLSGHRGPVNAVAIRGNQIVSASGDALVKLWDVETGECLREFRGHMRGLACVQFSEDARTIVSGGNDQVIRVWDAQTTECLMVLSGHEDLVRTLHLDSKNKRIISGSYDASVKVWNLDTGRMILDIKQFHSAWILAAKGDYKRIVSTSQDSKTLLLDFSAEMKGLEVLAGSQ